MTKMADPYELPDQNSKILNFDREVDREVLLKGFLCRSRSLRPGVAAFAVYRLPFLLVFFCRFCRFAVCRFFGQKTGKNGKN